MRGKERADNKKPASPASGERVFTLGHFVAAFFSDRILAFGELGTLGVRPRLPGPALEGHS